MPAQGRLCAEAIACSHFAKRSNSVMTTPMPATPIEVQKYAPNSEKILLNLRMGEACVNLQQGSRVECAVSIYRRSEHSPSTDAM